MCFTLFDFFPDRQNELAYYRDTLDLMISAEKLGFDSAWVGEEHFYWLGICPSPQLFLTALARETTRLRLGTAVSLLPFENPLRKAEDFAMLDLLSGGRLNFGVGRGSIPKHFEGFGSLCRKAGHGMKRRWRLLSRRGRRRVSRMKASSGRSLRLSLSPKPLQKPRPPIYRGTVSPEAFATAGAKGHGALFVPWLTPNMKQGVENYRTTLRTHGHSAVPPSVFVFFLFVDMDYRQALAEARETTGRYIELFARTFPRALLATLPPGDGLRDVWERVVSMPEHLEERAIVGTPRDCRRRLAEVRDEFGIEHMALYLHAGARDITRARQGLELFAKEVMPEFC